MDARVHTSAAARHIYDVLFVSGVLWVFVCVCVLSEGFDHVSLTVWLCVCFARPLGLLTKKNKREEEEEEKRHERKEGKPNVGKKKSKVVKLERRVNFHRGTICDPF